MKQNSALTAATSLGWGRPCRAHLRAFARPRGHLGAPQKKGLAVRKVQNTPRNLYHAYKMKFSTDCHCFLGLRLAAQSPPAGSFCKAMGTPHPVQGRAQLRCRQKHLRAKGRSLLAESWMQCLGHAQLCCSTLAPRAFSEQQITTFKIQKGKVCDFFLVFFFFFRPYWKQECASLEFFTSPAIYVSVICVNQPKFSTDFIFVQYSFYNFLQNKLISIVTWLLLALLLHCTTSRLQYCKSPTCIEQHWRNIEFFLQRSIHL